MGVSTRVIYVTNDPAKPTALRRTLEDDGLEIETAAAEVVDERIERRSADIECIVSEHDPPTIDAIELLELVREYDENLPFVVFTENGTEQLASAAVSADATEYISRDPDGDHVPALPDVIETAVEQYREERAAEATRRHLTQIAEWTDDALFVAASDWSAFRFVNAAAEDLWGVPFPDLREDTQSRLENVHPADRDAVLETMDRCAEGEDGVVEYRILPTEGRQQWVHSEMKPIVAEDGSISAIVGFVRDISDRVERTRRLETLVSNLPGIVYRCRNEPGWPMEYVKGECAEITGYPASAVANGDILWGEDIIHPSDQDRVWTAVQEGIENNGGFEITYRIQTSEGTTKWMWERGQLAEVETGERTAIEGFITDITDRVEKERQLERQNERLEEFANVLSHDLRNPLNVASGRLELVAEECESEHIPAIENAHDRMLTLIEDVLTLAREDEHVTDTEPVDLGDLVAECWRTVETGDGRIEVGIERTILADRNRLRQLLENLLRNAVDHGSADGESTVTVTIGPLDGGFYVADDGPGIPPEKREEVFTAGYSSRSNGTGFGLSIVERVAGAHGWTLDLTDSDDGGARFEITGVDAAE